MLTIRLIAECFCLSLTGSGHYFCMVVIACMSNRVFLVKRSLCSNKLSVHFFLAEPLQIALHSVLASGHVSCASIITDIKYNYFE